MKKYKTKTKDDQKLLWENLGLCENFKKSQVDAAYKKTEPKNYMSELGWKILRDKYFSYEYRKNKSIQRIFESGFFNDGLLLGFYNKLNTYWLKTPINKIEKNLKQIARVKECAVLLMTGALAPIHKGHILYMNAAKKELEKQGISVVGGYFSPAHDSYVATKDNGLVDMNARQRIKYCKFVVRKSNWLMVDEWESLHVSAPILFTLVYERLKKYLHYKFVQFPKLKVYLVVGSDNAAYVRAFAKHGNCVCIERYHYSKTYKQIFNEFRSNKRIIFIDYKNELLKCSSSQVRHGHLNMLLNEIGDNLF